MRISSFFDYKKLLILLIVTSLLISIISAIYFISQANLNLAYFDSNTRLNISRKIFDNLTPGLGQIGSIWLPFPHIMMVPLVYSDFLWRTGIAGWIVSGISYVLTGFYIYRSLNLLTKKPILGFIGALSFLVNINVIYLQTTAMSESFFWLTIAGSFYYLLNYIQTDRLPNLFKAGIFISLCTLTRYEGYALFGASIFIVFLHHIFRKIKWSITEGNTLLFTLLAGFGIILWSLYLWTIFGDPLAWLHYYAAEPSAPESATLAIKPSIFQALQIYLMAAINMSGVITFFIGILGFLFTLINWRIEKSIKLLLLFPLFLLIFMIATLSKNTPIEQPWMSLDTLFNKNLNLSKEFNIRYGLNLLVYLTIFSVFFVSRVRYSIFLFITLIVLQTAAYFYTPLYLTYQLKNTVSYGIPPYITWFNQNYDGGLILISAQKHDPEMIQMNLPYKTFIHEGTQRYWTESQQDPQRYARWVLYNSWEKDDQVNKFLHNSPDLNEFFDLVYNDQGIFIYKIKTQPDIIVKN